MRPRAWTDVASSGDPPGRFRSAVQRVLSLLPHHGAVAQLVAHLVRNEGVRGSSPLSSTLRGRLAKRKPSSAMSGLLACIVVAVALLLSRAAVRPFQTRADPPGSGLAATVPAVAAHRCCRMPLL